jgi:4-amino-4-deoxy-L-arabinose transferase-like glycosyltransferase
MTPMSITATAPSAPLPVPPEAFDRPAPPVAGRGPDDESPAAGQRWVLPALIALLTVTAVSYLWDLSASGNANSFYAAAVQAGTKSWKAFFFGSLDSSNFITVDKSPGSLWVMELSGRLFGFSSWSMLAPQVLEGVVAVALLYAAVKRWFGPAAGLLAGATLACTPVAALMFRFNNPDAFMVLLLVAAAYTLIRALERAGTRWIVATGALIGFAFLAKMLQAFTVLPAFAGVYLLAAPVALRRRLWQLMLGGLAIVASAGWWVAIVALWPTGSRPMIDGSPDNSILNLIFGYNGLSRLTGGTGGSGSGFSGATGVFRLFNDLMGGQASWLLPASVLALVAGLVWRGRAPRTDRRRAALLLWGGWLVVTGAVFSFSSGVIHTYYTVALAPAIAGLVGMGGAMLWQQRQRMSARIIGAIGILVTAAWGYVLLDRTPTYVPWLRFVIVVSGVVAAAALAAAPSVPRLNGKLTAAAVVLGLVAALGGPIAFTATTLTTAHTGSIPSAGPASSAGGIGGPGGVGGIGGAGGGGVGQALEGRSPGGTSSGAEGFPGGSGTRPSGEGATRFGGSPPSGSSRPTASGSGDLPSGALRSGALRSGTVPTGGAGASTSAALDSALRSGAGSYRWVAATFGSQSAATVELATGEPVMAIGGFNGEGGDISLGTFEAYVAKRDIHYFISSGGGGMGSPNGGGSSDSAITSWVTSHFTAKTVGGQTVYDLTDPK